VEKDDILVALSFHLDAPGEDAPVTFVWGEINIFSLGEGRVLRMWSLVRMQHHEVSLVPVEPSGTRWRENQRTPRVHPQGAFNMGTET
jgi:hypothetical protein